MKHLAIAAALSLLTAGAALADPAHGLWKSPTNESGASIEVEVAACGSALCGTIVKVNGGDQSVKGERMVWDMTPRGNGEYRGKIWAPDTGKTYNGRMELAGNAMKMSGCVLGVCRGETFTRLR